MAKKTDEKRPMCQEQAAPESPNDSVELARRLQACVDSFIAEAPERRRGLVPRSFETVISRLWKQA